MSTAGDKWTAHAAAYNGGVTRVTVQGGEHLVNLLHTLSPFTDDSRIFEAGAGSGVTTSLLRQRNGQISITATDPSAGMLEEFKKSDLPGVETLILDAAEDYEAKGLPLGTFTHALSTYVLQFVVPHEQAAINEMFRLLQPGGVIGNTMWTKSFVGEPWNIACRNLDPTFQPNDTAFSSALKTSEDLEARYRAAGFVDVQSVETELWFNFSSAEEYAEYFLHSGNPPFLKMMSSRKGDVEEVKRELIKVAREQFDDGKFLMVSASVFGRKA